MKILTPSSKPMPTYTINAPANRRDTKRIWRSPTKSLPKS